jgi:hypothetical protein
MLKLTAFQLNGTSFFVERKVNEAHRTIQGHCVPVNVGHFSRYIGKWQSSRWLWTNLVDFNMDPDELTFTNSFKAVAVWAEAFFSLDTKVSGTHSNFILSSPNWHISEMWIRICIHIFCSTYKLLCKRVKWETPENSEFRTLAIAVDFRKGCNKDRYCSYFSIWDLPVSSSWIRPGWFLVGHGNLGAGPPTFVSGTS